MSSDVEHMPPRQIPAAPSLTWIPATRPSAQAILFVHGYGGGLTTWLEFPTLLPLVKVLGQHDFFFYCYDAVYSDLTASSLLFRDEIERLATSPSTLINGALPEEHQRQPSFRYRSIVIISHSLGSVIARNALLYAIEAGQRWPILCRFVCFAPAHSGANVVRLASFGVSGFHSLSALFTLARFYSPLIDQLKPGSDHLRDIRERARHLKGSEFAGSVTPITVVVAERERVVVNLPFPGDPPPRAIADTTHQSVCKPSAKFYIPMDIVLDSINKAEREIRVDLTRITDSIGTT